MPEHPAFAMAATAIAVKVTAIHRRFTTPL
jgi:hypothetical protein